MIVLLFFALFLGKLIAKLTRSLKIGGGSAAPGLYSLKVDPDLVEKLASKIPQNIVINSKTSVVEVFDGGLPL